MKRLIIHLAVALVTFFIGISVESALTENRLSSPDTNPQGVQGFAQNVPEVSAAVNSASPVPEFVLGYDPGEFNPRGTYYILGRKPKDLREFDCLELVVEERDGRASGDATLYTKYFGGTRNTTSRRVMVTIRSPAW